MQHQVLQYILGNLNGWWLLSPSCCSQRSSLLGKRAKAGRLMDPIVVHVIHCNPFYRVPGVTFEAKEGVVLSLLPQQHRNIEIGLILSQTIDQSGSRSCLNWLVAGSLQGFGQEVFPSPAQRCWKLKQGPEEHTFWLATKTGPTFWSSVHVLSQ